MKKVHIISIGDPHLAELAILMKAKGYEVTCSGKDIMEPVRGKLEKFNLLPEQDGWFPEKLNNKYDFIIPANNITVDNTELWRAKELDCLVLSYPEYIYARIKNKTRILVIGDENKDDVLKKIFFVMKKLNLLFDYVVSDTLGYEPAVRWWYDARMAIIEDDKTYLSFIKKQINEYYRPHILLLIDAKFIST